MRQVGSSQRAYAKAGKYTVFLNGGLPTLGKRK